MLGPVSKNIFRAALVLSLLLVSALIYRGCKQGRSVQETPAKPLPSDTQTLVTIQNHKLITQTNKSTTVKYVPDEATTTVAVKNNGAIETHVQQAGLTFKPVLGPFLSDRLRLAGGVQFAYFNRFEAYTGVAGPNVVGWVGIGYRLDLAYLPNTSLCVSYMTDKTVALGLLVRL